MSFFNRLIPGSSSNTSSFSMTINPSLTTRPPLLYKINQNTTGDKDPLLSQYRIINAQPAFLSDESSAASFNNFQGIITNGDTFKTNGTDNRHRHTQEVFIPDPSVPTAGDILQITLTRTGDVSITRGPYERSGQWTLDFTAEIFVRERGQENTNGPIRARKYTIPCMKITVQDFGKNHPKLTFLPPDSADEGSDDQNWQIRLEGTLLCSSLNPDPRNGGSRQPLRTSYVQEDYRQGHYHRIVQNTDGAPGLQFENTYWVPVFPDVVGEADSAIGMGVEIDT